MIMENCLILTKMVVYVPNAQQTRNNPVTNEYIKKHNTLLIPLFHLNKRNVLASFMSTWERRQSSMIELLIKRIIYRRRLEKTT